MAGMQQLAFPDVLMSVKSALTFQVEQIYELLRIFLY